ncbi:hypothetical protein LX36DRAFT_541838, partial [Colletotrichum falcatum]
MSSKTAAKLAVLIDAHNIASSLAGRVFHEVAKYGTAQVRRAYGDWTTNELRTWRTQALDHSVQTIQQFAYTHSKNGSDSAMIIDAMDILHSKRLDGFCLVSSDCDFTPLARRLREDGLVVYGFGRQHTASAFVKACDKFIHLDEIASDKNTVELGAPEPQECESQPAMDPELKARIQEDMVAAYESLRKDESGWAALASIGVKLRKRYPLANPGEPGHFKLLDLVQTTGLFECQRR